MTRTITTVNITNSLTMTLFNHFSHSVKQLDRSPRQCRQPSLIYIIWTDTGGGSTAPPALDSESSGFLMMHDTVRRIDSKITVSKITVMPNNTHHKCDWFPIGISTFVLDDTWQIYRVPGTPSTAFGVVRRVGDDDDWLVVLGAILPVWCTTVHSWKLQCPFRGGTYLSFF